MRPFTAWLSLGLIATLPVCAQARVTYNRPINIITSDYDLVDTTYIDRGRINGVKVGDKFQVRFPDGKVVTQVVVTSVFDRMAAVKVVDSWLLKNGELANFNQRPMITPLQSTARRPAPDMTIAAKIRAKKNLKTQAATAPAKPTEPATSSAPAATPSQELPPAAPGGEPGLPAAPGAAADAGLPAAPGAPDAGLPPAPGAPDAGLPPAPGAAPDAGLPPAPGAPDAGLPPAPDAGLPPAPGAPDAGLPPAPGAPAPATDPGIPPPPM